MSTELHNRQDAPLELMPEAVGDMRAAIVTARFNSDITYALRDAALKTFKDAGIDDSDIDTFEVPGAVELTFAATQLIESGAYDVVIVFGCVIRGGTPHFDYVCQSVTQGITLLNSDCDIPVIFGVLTTDDHQQAADRAGGSLGNKGTECALAAIEMVQLTRDIREK